MGRGDGELRPLAGSERRGREAEEGKNGGPGGRRGRGAGGAAVSIYPTIWTMHIHYTERGGGATAAQYPAAAAASAGAWAGLGPRGPAAGAIRRRPTSDTNKVSAKMGLIVIVIVSSIHNNDEMQRSMRVPQGMCVCVGGWHRGGAASTRRPRWRGRRHSPASAGNEGGRRAPAGECVCGGGRGSPRGRARLGGADERGQRESWRCCSAGVLDAA